METKIIRIINTATKYQENYWNWSKLDPEWSFLEKGDKKQKNKKAKKKLHFKT